MTEEEILKELERKIAKEYKDTEAVIREKIAYYTKDFAKDNKKYQQMVKDGLMSQKDYKNWYKSQMFAQKWSNKMANEIADDLTKATETASKIINNDTSKVYLQGLQEGVKELEPYDDFTVFDTRQIKKIADENAKHLPKANPNIPKEERWNEKRIRSSLMQSAIKGESVQKLAGRLRVVVGMGRTSAIRNARTMMTASHNMGKLDLGNEAVDMGLDVRKKWIATFDNRTRDSHALLHGEVVDMDEEFSNGLMYPADPDGDPAEVYNCRCNMVITHDAKRGGMSEEEFEQNVAENEARKEEFREANRQLKNQNSGESNKPTGVEKEDDTNYTPSKMVDALKANDVEYNIVSKFDITPDENEIIERLGGADRTTGSCASLGFAYIGNKQGYDVLDFRGGKSLSVISRTSYIDDIIAKYGGTVATDINSFKAVNQVLGLVEEGKEYYFSAGKHASIIRKMDGKYEYLELQSMLHNGYHQLTNDALKRRFGCTKSRSVAGFKLEQSVGLIDIDNFKDSKEFEALLGYINTAPTKQKKGEGGGIK